MLIISFINYFLTNYLEVLFLLQLELILDEIELPLYYSFYVLKPLFVYFHHRLKSQDNLETCIIPCFPKIEVAALFPDLIPFPAASTQMILTLLLSK